MKVTGDEYHQALNPALNQGRNQGPNRRRVRAKAAVGLTGVLLLSLLGFVGAAPVSAHEPQTDGCSVVPDSSYFFDFHEVCDDHDLCYANRTHGSSASGRKRCDTDFYSAMTDSCRAMWPRWSQLSERGTCYTVAVTYYVGVRAFGGFGWNAGSDADLA